MKIAQALNRIVDYGWPFVLQDGIVHQMFGFHKGLGLWTYRCGAIFNLDAHNVDVCAGPMTCVACAAFSHLQGGNNPLCK